MFPEVTTLVNTSKSTNDPAHNGRENPYKDEHMCAATSPRGMRGIYQHCHENHLHRYLAEFDFRYSNRAALGCNDADRADAMLRCIVGKRLTYQTAGARD